MTHVADDDFIGTAVSMLQLYTETVLVVALAALYARDTRSIQ